MKHGEDNTVHVPSRYWVLTCYGFVVSGSWVAYYFLLYCLLLKWTFFCCTIHCISDYRELVYLIIFWAFFCFNRWFVLLFVFFSCLKGFFHNSSIRLYLQRRCLFFIFRSRIFKRYLSSNILFGTAWKLFYFCWCCLHYAYFFYFITVQSRKNLKSLQRIKTLRKLQHKNQPLK